MDGVWRLVDCHWSARRIVRNKVCTFLSSLSGHVGQITHVWEKPLLQGKNQKVLFVTFQVNPENLRYELDEYYFMPDPNQMIYSHYPDDPSLSLRDEPMTLTEFEDLVFLKPSFFKHGLTGISTEDAVINLHDQKMELNVGVPGDMDPRNTSFKFTLELMEGSTVQFDGIPLTRFGMQETVGTKSRFEFRFPVNGSYLLTLYIKNCPEKDGAGSAGMTHSSICEYLVQLDCEDPVVKPYPPCVYPNWGPGANAAKYDLVPLQENSVLHTKNGVAEIQLGLSKDLTFLTKLKSDQHSEEVLQQHVMHRVVGDRAVFTVTPPSVGEYGLEIYCRNPLTDGNTLYNACQYMIVCDEVGEAVALLLPLPSNYMGPQPGYRKLGMTLEGDPDPFIKSDGPEKVITFALSQSVVLLSQLLHVSDGQTKDCSNYILQQVNDNKVSLTVRMPKVGLYKYQIYAVPAGDQSSNLPCVFNFLVNCPVTDHLVAPFPKQYSQFKESGLLFEPLEGHLNPPPESPIVHFKVAIPRAEQVAAVVEGSWTHLKRTNEEESIWEGDANLEKFLEKGAKLVVCANFDKSQTTYSTLLEYSV